SRGRLAGPRVWLFQPTAVYKSHRWTTGRDDGRRHTADLPRVPPAVRREPLWRKPALQSLPDPHGQARAASAATCALVLPAPLASRPGRAKRQLLAREALDRQRPGREPVCRDLAAEREL